MKGVILDLDGVLRRGSEVIPGSIEAVRSFQEIGLKICYLTNNSTRSRSVLMRTLMDMGYPESILVSSAHAASIYIKRNFGPSTCLSVGEEGLSEELELQGHTVHLAGEGRGAGPQYVPGWSSVERNEMTDLDVDHVVAGLDRYLTYSRINDAQWCIRNGANFIATNTDPTLPFENGKVLPGAGTTISAIRKCTSVEPVVVGKPERFSTDLALEQMALGPGDVLMIGDRPDTDIEAGLRAGCHVAMVLTGDVNAPKGATYPIYPDLITLSRDRKLLK